MQTFKSLIKFNQAAKVNGWRIFEIYSKATGTTFLAYKNDSTALARITLGN